jgi:acyl-homoserine lactone synthase
MIHIVTSENRGLYAPELAAMRASMRARRRERPAGNDGWVDLIVLDDDDRDEDGTVHLLAFDDEMRLEGALRLDPTQQRCLMVDRFADLIAPDEPPKTGPDVWEATSLFTTKACRDRSRVWALWTAAMELALVNGARRIVGVIDMACYPNALDAPIEARLVGLPRPYALGVAAGVELALSGALVARLHEALGVVGPVGYHVDALDLRSFGGLANVQRQVKRAQVPQCGPGSARDEALSAETLYRLNDSSSATRRTWAERDADPPPERLNA